MNKLLSNIRYQKAHQRLLKKKYPRCPFLTKLIKLNEKQDDLIKWKDSIWKKMFNDGFVAGKDNDNPFFFDDFDSLASVEKEILKVSKSIERLEKKGHFLDKALSEYRLLNNGRLSQSY
jgi:hypothetical protein